MKSFLYFRLCLGRKESKIGVSLFSIQFAGNLGSNFEIFITKRTPKGAVIKNVTDWGGRDFVGV